MQNSKIKLKMISDQDGFQSKTEYSAPAKIVKKEDCYFLFFDEENFDGENELTKCRFEIQNEELRMRRNGPIVLEQIHINDKKTTGYLKTPFGHVDTRIRTFQYLFVERADKTFHLDLGYDLYTNEQKTGTYLLEIIIELNEGITL